MARSINYERKTADDVDRTERHSYMNNIKQILNELFTSPKIEYIKNGSVKIASKYLFIYIIFFFIISLSLLLLPTEQWVVTHPQ